MCVALYPKGWDAMSAEAAALVGRRDEVLKIGALTRNRAARRESDVQFWTRLENVGSFVLSELQRILFVSQNRLEIAEHGSERENFADTDWLKVLD
jgi:hypothetical protein